MRSIPTAPVAAASLIVGYAVAVASGSRPIGGVVLLIGGIWCIRVWNHRHGAKRAGALAAVAFIAFVASHLIALVIGAWPSVVLVSGVVAMTVWVYADSRALESPSRETSYEFNG
jgi:hypothetical protein